MDLQQLRAIGMAAERRVDHQAGGNNKWPVDNLRLLPEHLAFDFRKCLRRVTTDRTARAGLLRRAYLGAGERIDRVNRADMPAIELGRIRGKEVDRPQLLLLDIEHGIGKRIELSGMVPVAMANDDPFDGTGIQPDVLHLLTQIPPAAGGVPVEDVLQLLPTGVVERNSPVRPLDDPDIGREVYELNIVVGRAWTDEVPVRHERAKRTSTNRLLSTSHAE